MIASIVPPFSPAVKFRIPLSSCEPGGLRYPARSLRTHYACPALVSGPSFRYNGVTMKKYMHQVHYYETDRMGITHHSNYIRFMEEARVDFMEQIGWGYAKMESEGIASPVLAVSCDYKHSTSFSDVIEIDVAVLKCSAVKLHLGYTMTSGGRVVCTGTSTHCFLDKAGRPIVLQKVMPDFWNAVSSLASGAATGPSAPQPSL